MHDMTDIVTSGEISVDLVRGKYLYFLFVNIPCHTDSPDDCRGHNRMCSVICFDTGHQAHCHLPMTLVTHSDPYKIQIKVVASQFSAKLKLTEK